MKLRSHMIDCYFFAFDITPQFRGNFAFCSATFHSYIIALVPYEKRNKEKHKIRVGYPDRHGAISSTYRAWKVLAKRKLRTSFIDPENEKHGSPPFFPVYIFDYTANGMANKNTKLKNSELSFQMLQKR